MVRIHPDPPVSEQRSGNREQPTAALCGAVAQLGERLLCKQEAVGSIPSGSTNARSRTSIGCAASHSVQHCASRCAVLKAVALFNNSEGKGSLDSMRVQRAKG